MSNIDEKIPTFGPSKRNTGGLGMHKSKKYLKIKGQDGGRPTPGKGTSPLKPVSPGKGQPVNNPKPVKKP